MRSRAFDVCNDLPHVCSFGEIYCYYDEKKAREKRPGKPEEKASGDGRNPECVFGIFNPRINGQFQLGNISV